MNWNELMGKPMFWLAIYLMLINLTGFLLMGIDKHKARKGRWRIRERTLMLVAALGGALGSWAGMATFHHKTKHRLFTIGVPLFLVLQIAAFLYFGIFARG